MGDAESKPVFVSEQSNKSLGGSVFSIDFAPKRLIASMLVIGGNENFGIWDVQSDPNVNRFFNPNPETQEDANDENKHQHLIMEQTFNYQEDKSFVIKEEKYDDDEKEDDVDEFLDD